MIMIDNEIGAFAIAKVINTNRSYKIARCAQRKFTWFMWQNLSKKKRKEKKEKRKKKK